MSAAFNTRFQGLWSRSSLTFDTDAKLVSPSCTQAGSLDKHSRIRVPELYLKEKATRPVHTACAGRRCRSGTTLNGSSTR